MKIKMLENYRHQGQVLYGGNNYPVADGFGRMLVESGFAEDVDGVVKTGEKSAEPKRVKPEDMNMSVEG